MQNSRKVFWKFLSRKNRSKAENIISKSCNRGSERKRSENDKNNQQKGSDFFRTLFVSKRQCIRILRRAKGRIDVFVSVARMAGGSSSRGRLYFCVNRFFCKRSIYGRFYGGKNLHRKGVCGKIPGNGRHRKKPEGGRWLRKERRKNKRNRPLKRSVSFIEGTPRSFRRQNHFSVLQEGEEGIKPLTCTIKFGCFRLVLPG